MDEQQIVQANQNHMNTTFSFNVSVPKNQVNMMKFLLSDLHLKVNALENEITEFREISPVYQLNHSPSQTPVTFSELGFELLSRSLELEAATEKSFSPLAKSDDRLGTVVLDSENLTVERTSDGTWLGFGAIGKGFALDQVRRALLQEGFDNFLLSAGGSSLLLSGFPDPRLRRGWRWGWSWQKDENGEALGIPLQHESGRAVALGISGTEEKGRHITDPRTGLPSANLKSALIGTDSGADADALSTALFVDGPEKIGRHLQQLHLDAAMAAIDQNNVPRWNQIFQRWWGSLVALFLFFVFPGFADEVVDLGDVPLDDFTPYVVERNQWWILLPLFALGVVLVHLKDSRPKNEITLNPPEDLK